MRRGPAAVRSLVPHRLALTAVMLTAILAATLLSGLVSFAATVTSYAVRATLAASPATGILITSSAGSAAAAARDSRRVAAALRHALPGGPLTIDGSLGTDYLNLPAAVAGRHAQIHIISVPDPGRRAVLVAGTWPARAASGGGTALPVAVPAVTAGRLRLPRQHVRCPGGHHRQGHPRQGHRDLPPVSDTGRPDQHRGAAPHRDRRTRAGGRRGPGVRGTGPRRAAADPARLHRDPGHARPGAAGPGSRPCRVWSDAAGPGGAAGPGVRRRVPGRHERDGGGPAPAEGQREA